ncbi:anti-sigma factor [Streptomyces albipurpureus]|uniref:Anti-sigma factor n=1 Tax=Streptomyces albipurpureus TaxID=2897419 RepID=A0ABT0UTM1_9ACTN|nr:anti-sigma factor [Streptomyces sp. CWNU-1]MCM2391942.1 anti-sigma factor [Streptomyces sp. CWNU-1]
MAEHLDPEEMVELALERVSPHAADPRLGHIARCQSCRAEWAELRRAAQAVRDITAADLPSLPPEHVWDSIARQLGPCSPPPGARRPPPVRRWSTGARGRLAAVCLTAAFFLGGAVIWWGPWDQPAAVRPQQRTQLAPFGAQRALGTVELEQRAGGERNLLVRVRGLPATAGYFEVWLMDRTAGRMIALGVLGPSGSATLPLPRGVDLAVYALVDVSAQPYNGNPAHSGRSLVRGPLSLGIPSPADRAPIP